MEASKSLATSESLGQSVYIIITNIVGGAACRGTSMYDFGNLSILDK